MRAVCAIQDLRDVVLFCQSAAAKNMNIPAIGSLLLSAKEGLIEIGATNLDVWANANLLAETEDAGGVLVPASDLAAFVKLAPKSGEVRLLASGAVLEVDCGGYSTTFPTADPSDLPPSPEGVDTKEIDGPSFCEALHAANMAADKSDLHFGFQGVFLSSDRITATDRNFLVEAMCPCPDGVAIPSQAVALIVSLLGNGGKFGANEKIWVAESSGRRLVGKCLNAGLPDRYRRVSERPEVTGSIRVAEIGASDMQEALSRATLGDRRGVRIEGTPEGLFIEAIQIAGQIGGKRQSRGRAKVGADCVNEFISHVQSDYLERALKAMPDAQISVSHIKDTALVLQPVDRSAFLDRTVIVSEFRA